MPVEITFPTSSDPGTRPQEGGGRLINAYAEKSLPGAPSKIGIKRSPGLTRVAATDSAVHTRGFLDVGTGGLWILNNRIIRFDGTFNLFELGTLPGEDFVTTARNNALVRNNVAVTEDGCFNIFPDAFPTSFADADLPPGPTSVCDFDGYFIWSYGDGKIVASDLNSVAVQALSFNTEQGLFVRRVVRYAGRLYAFGDKWSAVYRNAGTSPFPLAREVTIPRGIVGTHAIAGWEAGWANQLLWVGDDFVVYRLDGYTPVLVSTNAVSRAIRAAVLAGLRNQIVAYVYMHETNIFWVVSCKDRFTWEYNLTSGEWNERMSYTRVGWKAVKTLKMFDKWVAGDVYSGELYTIDSGVYTEHTDPLIWQVESGVVSAFPRGIVVPRTSFNMTAGVGGPTSVDDPKVEISWSLDGGYSYGDVVIRRLGGVGLTNSHPYVLSCGLSRGQGIRYKLRVADKVHVGLFGGSIETEQRGFSG